jgi:hypothetical protein
MDMSKGFTLTLIFILAVSSLIMAKPAFAQTIPTPSVPQFSVQYISYTHYIAPTYTTNPYNGQNETATSGYQAINETIVFTIKNQPFSPYTDANGNSIGFYYNFRYKGHFASTWTYNPFNPDEQSAYAAGGWAVGPFKYFTQSSSNNTTFSFPLNVILNTAPSNYPLLSNGSQLDFAVQAQIGYIAQSESVSPSLGSYYNFTGQSSDWSNTQTLTINLNQNTTSSATPTQTPTSSVPEFPWMWAILTILFVVSMSSVVAKLKISRQGAHKI